jgi:hypothetical protein
MPPETRHAAEHDWLQKQFRRLILWIEGPDADAGAAAKCGAVLLSAFRAVAVQHPHQISNLRKRQLLDEIELERMAPAEKGDARSGYRYARRPPAD